jgi:hypothetical protein
MKVRVQVHLLELVMKTLKDSCIMLTLDADKPDVIDHVCTELAEAYHALEDVVEKANE